MRAHLGAQLLHLLFLQKVLLFFFFVVDAGPFAGHPVKAAVQIADLIKTVFVAGTLLGGDRLAADGKGVEFLHQHLKMNQDAVDQPGADGYDQQRRPQDAEDGDADRSQRCGADAAVIHQGHIFQPVGGGVSHAENRLAVGFHIGVAVLAHAQRTDALVTGVQADPFIIDRTARLYAQAAHGLAVLLDQRGKIYLDEHIAEVVQRYVLHLADLAHQEQTGGVAVLLGQPDEPALPPGSCGHALIGQLVRAGGHPEKVAVCGAPRRAQLKADRVGEP